MSDSSSFRGRYEVDHDDFALTIPNALYSIGNWSTDTHGMRKARTSNDMKLDKKRKKTKNTDRPDASLFGSSSGSVRINGGQLNATAGHHINVTINAGCELYPA